MSRIFLEQGGSLLLQSGDHLLLDTVPSPSTIFPQYSFVEGGQAVTIRGDGFETGATVDFAGTPATSVVVVDEQTITCVAPAHAAGVVTVNVHNTLTSGSISGAFTYVAHSLVPEVTTFKSFQYTLLTRGEDIRRQPGVQVRATLGNPPTTMECYVDGTAPQPQVGEKIEIRDSLDNDRLLFAGSVLTSDMGYEGQPENSQFYWDVKAADFTFLFNTKRPFGIWINVSVSDIVTELVARYQPQFTTLHVQTNLAKITFVLDGSDDMVTAFNNLAAAIGGGHWYIDYNMDVHFFHVVPPGLQVLPSAPISDFTHMTVAEGSLIPNLSGAQTFFDPGYYFFRHTFIYSDGSESAPMAISNVLLCTGTHQLVFSGVPTGVNKGELTCVGRRIYSNRFVAAGDPIDDIEAFVQVNDNVTTGFSVYFQAQGASVPSVVAVQVVDTFSTPLVPAPSDGDTVWVQLSDQAARIAIGGSKSLGSYGVPSTTKLSPPTSSGSVVNVGGLPAGWVPGTVLHYGYTFSTAYGETPLGVTGTVTLQANTGLEFLTPLNDQDPNGFGYHALYVSEDGVNYHRAGAGLVPGQAVAFITPHDLMLTFPTPPTINTALVGPITQWVGYSGATLIPSVTTAQATPPVTGGNVVYFATPIIAAELEEVNSSQQLQAPAVTFAGHLPGPSTPCVATIDTFTDTAFAEGACFQFKVAFLYRDGSVSYVGPASNTVKQLIVVGIGVKGYNLTAIPTGSANGSNDVVARFVYYDQGVPTNPNLTLPFTPPVGFTWPTDFNEPDWINNVGVDLIVIPDNITTALPQFALSALGVTSTKIYTGVTCGQGNRPYDNSNAQALSTDPIPLWPNPDGPYLENEEPPDDLTDDSQYLLHEDTNSQPFLVSTDLSQVRNRVMVVGAGSVTAATANVGDTQVQVSDITAFSPAGGTFKYNDSNTGQIVQVDYTGVTGVPGTAYVVLKKPLVQQIPQGSGIANFYVANNLDSQKFLAGVELDANGRKTDGVHEYTIVDTSLKALFQLFMRANAELEMYAWPIVTIQYATRDPKTGIGKTVHSDMLNPPCVGDFLIQQVTIDQIHDESDQLTPRYTVTATSTRFDLNDLLLKILASGVSSSGGNTSLAGIIPAGASVVDDVTPKVLPNPTYGRRFSSVVINFNTPNGITSVDGGLGTGINSAGSSSGKQDAYPGVGGIVANWVTFQPINLNANLCGYTTVARCLWEMKPKFICRFRTNAVLNGVASGGNHRCWMMGLASNTENFNGGDTTFNKPHVALFVKDPSDSQGFFETSRMVNGIQTIENVGFAPLLPSTHYRVTFQVQSIIMCQITIEDLTRTLTYTVNVPISGYDSVSIAGSSDDAFMGFLYGSASTSAVGPVDGSGNIDIAGLYLESD